MLHNTWLHSLTPHPVSIVHTISPHISKHFPSLPPYSLQFSLFFRTFYCQISSLFLPFYSPFFPPPYSCHAVRHLPPRFRERNRKGSSPIHFAIRWLGCTCENATYVTSEIASNIMLFDQSWVVACFYCLNNFDSVHIEILDSIDIRKFRSV